jgi:hypothetical protein
MKFWKLSLVTTIIFAAFIVIFLYTACERNVCDNVTCFNGGSCNVGTCRCPLGWEDPQCQTKSVARYLGSYGGYTTCNGGAQFIDSAMIRVDDFGVINVQVTLKSTLPKVLHGYVSSNESTYSVVVTNNDSTFTLYKAGGDSTYYSRYYTVTLQNDKTLSIHYYEKSFSPTDTIISSCSFLGNKL